MKSAPKIMLLGPGVMYVGIVYRLGTILLVIALTGAAVYLARPREFLLTYCSTGAFLAALLGMAWFKESGPRNSFLVLASISVGRSTRRAPVVMNVPM